MIYKLFLIIIITLFLSLTVVVATETMTAGTNDTFYFYSTNSPASQTGYHAAIVIEGKPYYLNETICKNLSEYSPIFKEEYDKISSLSVDKEVPIDKPIKFEWDTGTVGLNKEAHIINKIEGLI